MAKYGDAIRLAENALLYSQKEEEQMQEICVKMFTNVAVCSSKLGKYEHTVRMCEKVFIYNSGIILEAESPKSHISYRTSI